jgi:hypothetical protein
MSFVLFKRILPEGESEVLVNTDNIEWVGPYKEGVLLFKMLDGLSLEIKATLSEVEEKLKGE